MNLGISFVCGIILGAGIATIIAIMFNQKNKRFTDELLQQAREDHALELAEIISRMKDSFASLSYEALQKNTGHFLSVAGETFKNQQQLNEKTMENKKTLIDQSLTQISKELTQVNQVIQEYEKNREQKFGEINQKLQQTAEQTSNLRNTAENLNRALSNTRIRGQWGERMAEDVLRTIGMMEGLNYSKQETASSGNRPDYTFYLPQGKKINMDVKFPLDNYLRYLEETDETRKNEHQQQFMKDIKSRIKEVTGREYINPEENTLDYMLIFIPNEQIYNYIHETNTTLMDEALQQKVVLCSPLTLYAFLAVIRQAVDNFQMDQATGQIIKQFAIFNKQWNAFCEALEKVGRKISETQKEYDNLFSTRRKALERPLKAIENLRQEQQLASTETEQIEPIQFDFDEEKQ